MRTADRGSEDRRQRTEMMRSRPGGQGQRTADKMGQERGSLAVPRAVCSPV